MIPAKEKRYMMGEHSSYHQSIPGDEAERRLKKFDTHCYLTRFSNRGDCYVLSVYMQQTPTDVMKHFKIIIKDDCKVLIYGKDYEFDYIEQLLGHYENNRIDPALPTIGKNCVEKEYKDRKEREAREQKEQREREEREERDKEEKKQRDREERERERERREREEREREARERRERERREREERERRDMGQKCTII